MPATPAVAKLFAPDDRGKEFTFPLNPNRVRYVKSPAYADVPLAGWGGGVGDAGRPIEWNRNKAEDIQVEFMLHASGQDNVEDALDALDDLMAKSPRTGEPLDLVFSFGPRRPIVRIVNKDVEPLIWDESLKVKQARVSLTLRTIYPYAGGSF